MDQCVFCRIARGELPATIVFEDEATIAFMDIGSVNPGHMLVATKAHAEDIFGLSDDLAEAVFRTTARVSRAARDALGAPGLSLFQANGRDGGQTVFHFHIHVLPRWPADGMDLAWPVKNPPREELERVALRIRERLAA